jgi:nucleoside-diphosphate-sugar epimerase
MHKKIVIVALGRLGQTLYTKLTGSSNQVVGTFHSNPKGLKGEFKYDFSKDAIPFDIQDSDILVFNLTPSVIQSVENFQNFIQNIRTKRLIFISSTSVYGMQGEVDEDSPLLPESESGKLLQSCELTLFSNKSNSCVVRPAGIYGPESHPGRYMAGREVSVNGNESINLIDINSLADIIINNFETKYNVVNAVNSHHPKKEDYYIDYCKRNNLQSPTFQNKDVGKDKIVKTKYQEFEITISLA